MGLTNWGGNSTTYGRWGRRGNLGSWNQSRDFSWSQSASVLSVGICLCLSVRHRWTWQWGNTGSLLVPLLSKRSIAQHSLHAFSLSFLKHNMQWIISTRGAIDCYCRHGPLRRMLNPLYGGIAIPTQGPEQKGQAVTHVVSGGSWAGNAEPLIPAVVGT